jgi:hypothetical protein
MNSDSPGRPKGSRLKGEQELEQEAKRLTAICSAYEHNMQLVSANRKAWLQETKVRMEARDQKIQEILQKYNALGQHCLALRREKYVRDKGKYSCVLTVNRFADSNSFVHAMRSVGDETEETYGIVHYGWKEL